MSKQFSKLSKREQERVEATYHHQNPGEFDALMARATLHTPDVIRLPSRLTAKLKIIAEREGEPEYRTMVTRWVRERAQKEIRLAAKSPKRQNRKKEVVLKRSLEK